MLNALRQKALLYSEGSLAQKFIVFLIILNAATLGLETSKEVMATYGSIIHVADKAILTIFVLELVLRIFGHGWRFFTQPWGIFDFLIVSVALLPATAGYSVLRALRLLRLFSMIPQMRRVVSALLLAIPNLASILMVLAVIFYVFSVMATNMFGASFDDWFGSVGRSMYTLFQMMTLESWSMGIARPVMEVHPHAWAFFVVFILLATFIILNLIMGVIVDALQSQAQLESERTAEHIEDATHKVDIHLAKKLDEMSKQLSEIQQKLGKD